MDRLTIEIKNISKRFKNRTVLKDISLLIEGGTCLGVIGRNGAGKTTLINCLLDLIIPDEGNIYINSQSISVINNEYKQKLGFLSDEVGPIDEFTGQEYLQFIGQIYKIDHKIILERITSLNDFLFGDNQTINQPIASYSTGMRKKIALCASFIHKPSILILDEPFTGLDPVSAHQLIKLIQSYCRPEHIIIVASHDLAYLEQIANRIVVIEEGTAIYDDSLEKFVVQGESFIDTTLYMILRANEANLNTPAWL